MQHKIDSRQRARQLRHFFMRWHKRIGLACLLIFLLVAVTGVLLNHTSELKLGKRSVSQPWLLQHYGFKLPDITSYQVNGYWLSDLGDDYLYRNSDQLAYCQGRLVGAVKPTKHYVVVACEQELLLLTPDGEVIEHIGAVYNLPLPLAALGTCDGRLCLKSGKRVYLADVDQLSWQPLDATQAVWSEPSALPERLNDLLEQHSLGSGLDLERVFLDLHSGRIAGPLGVLIVDLAALGMVLLSVSGFWLWWRQQRTRYRRK